MASSSSSSTSSPHNLVHHVFTSFHGTDVRKSFLSHVLKELGSKGINSVIVNDTQRIRPEVKDIEKSKSVGPELLEDIRESRVAIVLLSKNYASSTWCLNELVEIMKCREEFGQKVMPLFYQVDPTHVKKQTGDFGKAFEKTCRGKKEEDIQKWKHALAEVAKIAGHHSSKWNNEADMIEDIANDLSNKLNNPTSSSDFRGLAGMGDHIKKIEQLLRPDLDEVRFIGISGLPGSGKTTIANHITQLFSHHFQLSTVINIKVGDPITFHDEHKAKFRLQNQLYSQLINQKDTGKSFHQLGVAQERFKDKKVLVVIDDADQLGLGQLEVLAEELRGFGPGSRIIVTSQDRTFLKAQGIKHIYKVGFPASDEALRIFCMYAFGRESPYVGFEKLSQEITTLSGELPAGIRFMGSYFRGMSKEEWKNELPRLRTSVDGGLGSIIKFTYHALSGEDKKLAHHYISSSRDVELTEKMETFLRKGLSQVKPKPTITNQDLKENVNTSERASKGTSSNGLLHTVYIYCENKLQYSFATHLSADFHRKGIGASVNCNDALNVIEGASAFVVVLSENYLSSPSCLDKLVKVLQCRRKYVQLVVPVFYGISPADVAVQEQESDDRIREWTSALQELREFPGIHSREESSDCELVEDIVKDVYEKLFPMQHIGINSRLLEIKQLLCKQPWGIRHIGIWGMPGIGKTTLAKAFFDQVSGGYEASCFIKDFDKAFHEKGLYRLWDENFGKILKDIPRVSSSITRPSLPGETISKKRTLVVLDDVQNPLVAESFLEGFHWFAPGSLIIITSRDKRVFRLCQINHVYEVQSLNKNEALQLFSQCAFGKDIEEENLLELSMEVVDYANGNPLALRFYGGELEGTNLLEVNATFPNFKLQTPNMFHDLLKSSYETLNDDEKDIFLDIACFFKGDDVDNVKQLLEGCGLFPHIGIDVLVEKCLVTISGNRVEMHRIIQDFGREINNKETTWIKRGRRLWEPSTIKVLLEANGHPKSTGKGALVTEDIKAISLHSADLRDLKPNAFENMLNLRFLKVCYFSDESFFGLSLPKGLDSLPCGLGLLHWEYYPLQSLPQDFDPGHLVQLNMPYSQLRNLWRGTKNLDMLKMVRLCHSQKLTEIDDICKAQNIKLIDLQGCTRLQSFPATDQLQHLRVVNLSGCIEIKNLPEFSPNIEELNLHGTAIRELQMSIGNATNLKKLNLSYCESLVKLPSSIGNATNLQILDLSFCSSLMELPSSIGNATNLEILDLEYCSILVKLPSSIGNAFNLQELNLRFCTSLLELPSTFGNATNLKKLYLSGCSSLVQLPSSIGNVPNLEILDLSSCSSLKKLPASIGNATNLESLNLEYCSRLVELPSSIGNATNLKKLCLRGCSGLVKLPFSIANAINLQELNLEFCSSLVELPSSFGNSAHLKKLYLTGCSSLYELPSSIRNSTSLISIDLNNDNSLPIVTVSDNSGSKCIEVRRAKGEKFYVLEGEQKDENSVSLLFRLVYDNGHEMITSYFTFYQNTDTAYKVSSSEVENLKLSDLHVTFIAEMIDILLVNLIPTWKTEVTVDHIIHSQLNQNSRSHRSEAKTQRGKETAFRDYASVSNLGKRTKHREKNIIRRKKGRHCAADIEEKESSYRQEAEEANEPASLEEEERRKMEEIEAKYQEKMKEIKRTREKSIMEMRKKQK